MLTNMAAIIPTAPIVPSIIATAGTLLWCIGCIWPMNSENKFFRPPFSILVVAALMTSGVTSFVYYLHELVAAFGKTMPLQSLAAVWLSVLVFSAVVKKTTKRTLQI